MNKAVLIGRLTRDPDCRVTQSGTPVTTFTLAVGRPYRDDGSHQADFIQIVTWNKLADIAGKNLTKGRRVAIEGRIQVRRYTAQDGESRYMTEVIANALEFLDSRQEGAPGQPAASNQPDEDIPF